MRWSEITVAEIWDELKPTNTKYRHTAFDYNNPHKVRTLRQYAKEYNQ